MDLAFVLKFHFSALQISGNAEGNVVSIHHAIVNDGLSHHLAVRFAGQFLTVYLKRKRPFKRVVAKAGRSFPIAANIRAKRRKDKNGRYRQDLLHRVTAFPTASSYTSPFLDNIPAMRCCALLLLCAFSLSAASRQVTLVKTVDGGTSTIHLSNEYDSAATAWIVGCESSAGSQWHWTDRLLGLEGKPIEPGAQYSYRVPKRPNMTGTPQTAASDTCEEFQVLAAVFADGTVTGELHWINGILGERQKAYRDIAKVTELLTKGVAEGTEPAAAVKELTSLLEAEGSHSPGNPGRSSTYGESYGWRPANSKSSRAAIAVMIPPRPFARIAGFGAAIWLIQEKKKTLPEAINLLSAWHDQLGQWSAVTGSAVSGTVRLMSSAGAPSMIERPRADIVGKPAADFTLKDVDGKEVRLASLRGKTVLLDFWATWCEPCRRAMPDIKAVYEAYHAKGLEVVCIDFSEPAAVARKSFDENKYSFINLLDPASEVFNKYGGGGIPKTLLIDKDGVVRYFQQGFSTNEDFMAEVKKLGL